MRNKRNAKSQKHKRGGGDVSITTSKCPVDLTIAQAAMDEVWAYTKFAKGEMSVLGIVDEIRDEDGEIQELRIREVFLPKQDNSSAETDMDDDSVNEILYEIASRGNGDGNKLRAWIHSHGSMEPFWSGTDTSTIAKWAPQEGHAVQYLVSVVVNKQKKFKARLDIFIPKSTYTTDKVLTYDNQQLKTVGTLDQELLQELKGKLNAAATFQEPNPLFTATQERALERATNLCLKETQKIITDLATVMVANPKERFTKKRVSEFMSSKNRRVELKKCLAAQPGVKHLLKSVQFDALDYIQDAIAEEPEESA